MNRPLRLTLLGLAVSGAALSAGVANTSMQTPAHRCSKGSMHVAYKGRHKCLGVAKRKLIYYELARWQDTHPGQDARAYSVIAARFRIPVSAVKVIVVEGLKKGWPLPPSRAVAGTYTGRTSQSGNVTFEVLPGGTALKDFFIGPINLLCQAPDFGLYPETSDDYRLPKTASITGNGTFVVATDVDTTPYDDVRWQWEMRVTGRFSGNGASGGLGLDVTITIPGLPVATCSSPKVTWTAVRDGGIHELRHAPTTRTTRPARRSEPRPPLHAPRPRGVLSRRSRLRPA